MPNVPRIIELPSPSAAVTEPVAKFPTELLPPLERPLDIASIDARMQAQLPFTSSHAPRNFPELAAVQPSSRPNRAGKLKRGLAIGTMALVGTVGAVTLIGRAVDGEAKFHKPYHPTPAQLHLVDVQSRINSGH